MPKRGRVAQLVEQRIENPRVVGSIPTPATKIKGDMSIFRVARPAPTFALSGRKIDMSPLIPSAPKGVVPDLWSTAPRKTGTR
jgi:hypothetical protein